MYESTYRMTERLFHPIPIASRYYPAAAIEEARTTLERVILRGEGPGMVVGPAGTGKTMLCRVLADRFRSQFSLVQLGAVALGSRRDLFQAILHELKRPFRGLDDGEIGLALLDALTRPEIPTNGVLLIVDEAHLMTIRLIEELRLLTNLDHQGQPCVRLIIAADSVLEERFTNPKLVSINQRLASRCYLQEMNQSEVAPYLAHHVQRAGAAIDQIFLPDAINAIAQSTDGNPRQVNQLADHALVLKVAQSKTAEPLSADEIHMAWADLQQLPAPSNLQLSADRPSIVEFGTFSDDDDAIDEDGLILDFTKDTDQEEVHQGQQTETADIVEFQELDSEVPEAVEHQLNQQAAPEEFSIVDERDSDEVESLIEVSSLFDGDTPVWEDELNAQEFNELDTVCENENELESVTETKNDPFSEPFANEYTVPVRSDSTPFANEHIDEGTSKFSEDIHSIGDVPEEVSNDEPAQAGCDQVESWLPVETLWVTIGTIPTLPSGDEELLVVEDTQTPINPREIPQVDVIESLDGSHWTTTG